MISFLVLHRLNNLLTRNHMTKHHMDTEKQKKQMKLAATLVCKKQEIVEFQIQIIHHLPIQMW